MKSDVEIVDFVDQHFLEGVHELICYDRGLFNVPLGHLQTWFAQKLNVAVSEAVISDAACRFSARGDVEKACIGRTYVEYVFVCERDAITALQKLVRSWPSNHPVTLSGVTWHAHEWTAERLQALYYIRTQVDAPRSMFKILKPSGFTELLQCSNARYCRQPPHQALCREVLLKPLPSKEFTESLIVYGFAVPTNTTFLQRRQTDLYTADKRTTQKIWSYVDDHVALTPEPRTPSLPHTPITGSPPASVMEGEAYQLEADDTESSFSRSASESTDEEPCTQGCHGSGWCLGAVAHTTKPTQSPSLYTLYAVANEKPPTTLQPSDMVELNDVVQQAYLLHLSLTTRQRIVLLNWLHMQRAITSAASRLHASTVRFPRGRFVSPERYALFSLWGRKYCWQLIQALQLSPSFRGHSLDSLEVTLRLLHQAEPWSLWFDRTHPVIVADVLCTFYSTRPLALPRAVSRAAMVEVACSLRYEMTAAEHRYQQHPTLRRLLSCQDFSRQSSFGYAQSSPEYKRCARTLEKIAPTMSAQDVEAVDDFLRFEHTRSINRMKLSYECISTV